MSLDFAFKASKVPHHETGARAGQVRWHCYTQKMFWWCDVCVRVCVRVRVCLTACLPACMRACVCVCARARVCVAHLIGWSIQSLRGCNALICLCEMKFI